MLEVFHQWFILEKLIKMKKLSSRTIKWVLKERNNIKVKKPLLVHKLLTENKRHKRSKRVIWRLKTKIKKIRRLKAFCNHKESKEI